MLRVLRRKVPSSARNALRGWVSAPFYMADVIAGLSREFEPDIALDVIDGSAPEGLAAAFADPRVQSVNTPRQLFRQVQFGGRTWTLRMRPLPAFEDRYEYETHHISALFGVVLSIVTGLVCVVAGHWPHPGRSACLPHDVPSCAVRATNWPAPSTPFPIC